MVALGRTAQWSRSDIRQMTPDEFADYLDAAMELEKAQAPQHAQ